MIIQDHIPTAIYMQKNISIGKFHHTKAPHSFLSFWTSRRKNCRNKTDFFHLL